MPTETPLSCGRCPCTGIQLDSTRADEPEERPRCRTRKVSALAPGNRSQACSAPLQGPRRQRPASSQPASQSTVGARSPQSSPPPSQHSLRPTIESGFRRRQHRWLKEERALAALSHSLALSRATWRVWRRQRPPGAT